MRWHQAFGNPVDTWDAIYLSHADPDWTPEQHERLYPRCPECGTRRHADDQSDRCPHDHTHVRHYSSGSGRLVRIPVEYQHSPCADSVGEPWQRCTLWRVYQHGNPALTEDLDFYSACRFARELADTMEAEGLPPMSDDPGDEQAQCDITILAQSEHEGETWYYSAHYEMWQVLEGCCVTPEAYAQHIHRTISSDIVA